MEPSADEIRLQLDRLLASGGFANADRMSGFLRYVVERAMAGESDQVKEYVIGVAVFGRDEQYDPRLDSIVRVEARRLRTKLDEYYADEGRDDPIVIRDAAWAATPRPSNGGPRCRRRNRLRAAALDRAAATDPVATRARRARRPPFWSRFRWRFTVWRTGLWTSVGSATPMVTDRGAAIRRVLERRKPTRSSRRD